MGSKQDFSCRKPVAFPVLVQMGSSRLTVYHRHFPQVSMIRRVNPI